MDYVISYEVMSIVILALILVSYTCHKWLDIKRNRTFNLLVIMTICTVIVDLIGRSCVYVVGSNALFMATVVATVVNLSLYQVCLLFYKYTLNTLGCANVFYQGISAVFLVFDLLVDIALLSNPWTHFFFEYNGLHKGQYQIHYGMVVLLICAEILMLADAYFLYRYRHKVAKRAASYSYMDCSDHYGNDVFSIYDTYALETYLLYFVTARYCVLCYNAYVGSAFGTEYALFFPYRLSESC